MTAGVVREQHGGGLTAPQLQAILQQLEIDYRNRFTHVDVTERLVRRAREMVEKHGLKGYDGVQLAGVLVVNDERAAAGVSLPTLVSADFELNAAARAEGISVEDPNAYP